MKYRKIGNTEVKVSTVSLGCWTMGGLNWVNGEANGWANVNEDEVCQAIKSAVDSGVNHFDNADVYGNGRAERMLGRCLKKLGLKSENFIISTKVGHFAGTAGNAYEPAHIRHQLEQSLINLKRDYIDIYYFHHGYFGENDVYLDDALGVIENMVHAGKIRIKALSSYSTADFLKLEPKIRPQVFQSWGNILNDEFIRPQSAVSKLMVEKKISFVAFSPLAQGILLDKYKPNQPPKFEGGDYRQGKEPFSTSGLERVQKVIGALKERFGSSTEDLSSVAIAYILAQPQVACAIPGFRNTSQVGCNLKAAEKNLTSEDILFIQKLTENKNLWP